MYFSYNRKQEFTAIFIIYFFLYYLVPLENKRKKNHCRIFHQFPKISLIHTRQTTSSLISFNWFIKNIFPSLDLLNSNFCGRDQAIYVVKKDHEWFLKLASVESTAILTDLWSSGIVAYLNLLGSQKNSWCLCLPFHPCLRFWFNWNGKSPGHLYF